MRLPPGFVGVLVMLRRGHFPSFSPTACMCGGWRHIGVRQLQKENAFEAEAVVAIAAVVIATPAAVIVVVVVLPVVVIVVATVTIVVTDAG